MNARQKAKKYKRMYEALLHQPVRVKVEHHQIDTFKADRYFPEEIIKTANDEILKGFIVREIVNGLGTNADKYIEWETEYCRHVNMYRLSGEIRVIRK